MIKKEEILKELVKFNTIKDKDNSKIMDYLENILKEMGFRTIERDRILIMSNSNNPALGFIGHTDTVEYTKGWKTNPFELTQIDNRLYGLGVCDMKSGIATIISAISQIDFTKLNSGIKLYFTYDEEIGFSGIKDVIKRENEYPNTVIIGESTNNEVVVGSKGLIEYKITFRGIKTHSSNPEKGKNAINEAINFINELNKFYNEKIINYKKENFEIPYTTMNIGVINGGSAINSVPDYCEFLVDFRTTDVNIENLIVNKIQELQNKYNAQVYELNKLSSFFNEIDNYNKTCNFITEASFFKNNRIILGTGPVTAHEVNEYITIESLEKLETQYKELIMKYCK